MVLTKDLLKEASQARQGRKTNTYQRHKVRPVMWYAECCGETGKKRRDPSGPGAQGDSKARVTESRRR